jgi:hypothetical protein
VYVVDYSHIFFIDFFKTLTCQFQKKKELQEACAPNRCFAQLHAHYIYQIHHCFHLRNVRPCTVNKLYKSSWSKMKLDWMCVHTYNVNGSDIFLERKCMGTPVQRYVEFGLWPADRLLLVGLFHTGYSFQLLRMKVLKKKILRMKITLFLYKHA